MAEETSHIKDTEEIAVAEANTEENPDDEVDGSMLLTTAEEILPESEDEGSIKSSATDNTATKKPSPKQPTKPPTPKRVASVADLWIPFRTIKKAMKLEPDVPLVQNEAAIMATVATELFLKNLANAALKAAKANGRNYLRYEDVAEARSKNKALSFLEPMFP